MACNGAKVLVGLRIKNKNSVSPLRCGTLFMQRRQVYREYLNGALTTDYRRDIALGRRFALIAGE